MNLWVTNCKLIRRLEVCRTDNSKNIKRWLIIAKTEENCDWIIHFHYLNRCFKIKKLMTLCNDGKKDRIDKTKKSTSTIWKVQHKMIDRIMGYYSASLSISEQLLSFLLLPCHFGFVSSNLPCQKWDCSFNFSGSWSQSHESESTWLLSVWPHVTGVPTYRFWRHGALSKDERISFLHFSAGCHHLKSWRFQFLWLNGIDRFR